MLQQSSQSLRSFTEIHGNETKRVESEKIKQEKRKQKTCK